MDPIIEHYKELEKIGYMMPKGKCDYCDRERKERNLHFPSHKSSSRCKSGGYNHCTCDTCF